MSFLERFKGKLAVQSANGGQVSVETGEVVGFEAEHKPTALKPAASPKVRKSPPQPAEDPPTKPKRRDRPSSGQPAYTPYTLEDFRRINKPVERQTLGWQETEEQKAARECMNKVKQFSASVKLVNTAAAASAAASASNTHSPPAPSVASSAPLNSTPPARPVGGSSSLSGGVGRNSATTASSSPNDSPSSHVSARARGRPLPAVSPPPQGTRRVASSTLPGAARPQGGKPPARAASSGEVMARQAAARAAAGRGGVKGSRPPARLQPMPSSEVADIRQPGGRGAGGGRGQPRRSYGVVAVPDSLDALLEANETSRADIASIKASLRL